MRLFGKNIGITSKSTEQKQRNAEDRYLASMSKRELEQNRKLAKRQLERQLAEKRRAEREADESVRYEKENTRLKRQGDIESARTRIARERAARAAAMERKYSGYRGTIKSAASVIGIKSNKDYDRQKPRSIYVSTTHGLKKISPDNPDYYKYRERVVESPTIARRVPIKESSDDFEQPSAFNW